MEILLALVETIANVEALALVEEPTRVDPHPNTFANELNNYNNTIKNCSKADICYSRFFFLFSSLLFSSLSCTYLSLRSGLCREK